MDAKRAANLLTLSLASFRAGNIDTAFELFVEAAKDMTVAEDKAIASNTEMADLITAALANVLPKAAEATVVEVPATLSGGIMTGVPKPLVVDQAGFLDINKKPLNERFRFLSNT